MGTRPPRRGLGGGRRAHRGIAGSIRQNPPGARRFLPTRGRLKIPAPEDLEEVEVAARPVAVGRQGERPPAVVAADGAEFVAYDPNQPDRSPAALPVAG